MFDPIDLSFFDDAVLDALASGEPQINGSILLELCRQAQGPILELGCGYGRITIPLAQRGVQDLTGLELSGPSLAAARAQTGDLPIHWVEADVRDFHLDRRYAFIFARGDVFNFMLTRADQEAMLARVHEHLDDDGLFLVDTMPLHPNKMVDEPEEQPWYLLSHPTGRQIHTVGRQWFDHVQQLYCQRAHDHWDSAAGELVRPPWQLVLRYVMPQEMAALLHYNGFLSPLKQGSF
ncbi:MAG: class I SAM-dependent methyltransferase [Caldilineaceae bacterium]|nr:class I SAM-dependent methyltransferase [Caldilineaceae bacterium]